MDGDDGDGWGGWRMNEPGVLGSSPFTWPRRARAVSFFSDTCGRAFLARSEPRPHEGDRPQRGGHCRRRFPGWTRIFHCRHSRYNLSARWSITRRPLLRRGGYACRFERNPIPQLACFRVFM